MCKCYTRKHANIYKYLWHFQHQRLYSYLHRNSCIFIFICFIILFHSMALILLFLEKFSTKNTATFICRINSRNKVWAESATDFFFFAWWIKLLPFLFRVVQIGHSMYSVYIFMYKYIFSIYTNPHYTSLLNANMFLIYPYEALFCPKLFVKWWNSLVQKQIFECVELGFMFILFYIEIFFFFFASFHHIGNIWDYIDFWVFFLALHIQNTINWIKEFSFEWSRIGIIF